MSGIMSMVLGARTAIAAAVDEFFNRVTLLLPGDGTNGAQNNTFLDSGTANSGSGFTITRNGNTTQGTFSPFSQTGWSNLFGSGTYLSMGDNAALQLTADFTIEFFIFTTSLAAQQRVLVKGNSASNDYSIDISTYSTSIVIDQQGVASQSFTVPTISPNTWNHLVVCRNSSVATVFLNGTRSSTGTTANTINYSTASDIIGYQDGVSHFPGYLSDFRVVLGSTPYDPTQSTITVPTAPLTAITNTVLLTCQSNRFVDNSSSPKTITVANGTPSVQAFSPFAPTAAYSAATNGGSGYFDGTGDYLTIPQNAAFNIGTGAFTVEAWVYPTAWPTTQDTSIMSLGEGATAATYRTGWGLLLQTDGTPRWYRYDGSTETAYPSSIKLTLNQWNHVVVVRNGSSNLSIYVNGARGYNNASANVSYNNINTNPLYISRFVSGTGPTTAHLTGYNSSQRLVVGSNVYDPTQTSITVPTAPPTAITNTQLLLNYTNAGVTDATAKNVLETVGNAQISTTQSKFGGSSIYIPGTSGSYAIAQSSQFFNLFGGDMTIEFWFYQTSTTNTSQHLLAFVESSTYRESIYFNSTTLTFWTNGGTTGAARITVAAPSINTWNHFALVKSGSTFTMYLNGVSAGTSTTTAYSTAAQSLRIGTYDGAVTNDTFSGYIDDIRITRGYSRYTGNFTPPTAAFALQ